LLRIYITRKIPFVSHKNTVHTQAIAKKLALHIAIMAVYCNKGHETF
jgi:hypothetical protein